ncbi:succinate CoA transferase [bacterium]|nr:succinate CoA transferase [bacterium]
MIEKYAVLTPEEAAEQVHDGMTVAMSCFTAAGAVKVIPAAIAKRADAFHEDGKPFKINLITGASSGDSLDGSLAAADAIKFRCPYQSDAGERKKINNGEIDFFDLHLSHVPQYLEYGFLGDIDIAVVEATAVTPEGHVYLTTSQGASSTFLRKAKKVLIEVNRYHNPRLREMHDVYEPPPPPRRRALQIFHPLDKIGTPFCLIDPKKVIGVVETNLEDEAGTWKPFDDASANIGRHVVDFLVREQIAGRVPYGLLPLQAGVGNVANAVMATLGQDARIPPFYFYTEVAMDSMIDLIAEGKCLGASTCSLTVTKEKLRYVYDNFDTFADKIVIRPQVITNNPEAIRRLGVISMNTALEADIYGNVNSTNVCGSKMMNGIGGSGDFTRNAYISMFMTPSIAKGGAISAIVPFVSHVDHNEHSVQVLVTDQGLADLRGKTPRQRAELVIENCAHPDYRPLLREYLAGASKGHIPHDLRHAFDFHLRLMESGSMMPAKETAGV